MTGSSCGTRSVSCIDCGVVFDSASVRGHVSCITEEEKFGPKREDACTQTFCGVCKLQLCNGVHAVQHYASRKHRAAVKRKEQRGGAVAKDDGKRGGGDAGVERKMESGGNREMGSEGDEKVRKVSGLGGVMKKVLRAAKKQRLKKKYLVKGVAELLGKDAPQNLEGLVERKIRKSGRFRVRKERVMLSDVARR